MGASPPRVRRPMCALLLGCALVASTCGGDLPSGPGRFGDDRRQTVAELEAAAQRWRAQGLTSYSFRFQRSCFCANREAVVVQVRGGRVAAVLVQATGVPVAAGEVSFYKSIEGLFDDLRAAANLPADTIRARFDERLGYPADVYIDASPRIADEEYGYTVDQFER